MSEGVRDAERYVESVLGMDDGAFRASVFAEQKQLAAFSDHSPAERLPAGAAAPRHHTPRRGARRGPHGRPSRHRRPRPGSARLLPDLEALRVEAADAEARAAAVAVRGRDRAGGR